MNNFTVYSNLSDKELVSSLREGVEGAFVEIYERYKTVLFLHARRMLNGDEQARDVVQEVFTTIWQKKADLTISSTLKAYLYGAVKNKVLNIILHQKHVEKHLNHSFKLSHQGNFATDEKVRERELSRLIEAEIQALPPRMREVFVLSRKEHLSNLEIAHRMNISEETVKKQIVYALKNLRTKLKFFALLVLLGAFLKSFF